MIKSRTHSLTLAFCEVVALEEHLSDVSTSLEIFTSGASYAASAHGITIGCTTEKQAEDIWEAVLLATDDRDEMSDT